MKPSSYAAFMCLCLLVSCAGGSKSSSSEHEAVESLSGRLNQNYGYQVDEKGNWLPNNDKRSQFEGRGESAYFKGGYQKKPFQAETLQKGSWMGGKEVGRPVHRLNGSGSTMGTTSSLGNQQASLDRSLQTPARIAGNHLPDKRSNESSVNRITTPSDAVTDGRRKVFVQPDVIDYKQQRELSIQESKRLLGRED